MFTEIVSRRVFILEEVGVCWLFYTDPGFKFYFKNVLVFQIDTGSFKKQFKFSLGVVLNPRKLNHSCLKQQQLTVGVAPFVLLNKMF